MLREAHSLDSGWVLLSTNRRVGVKHQEVVKNGRRFIEGVFGTKGSDF